MSIKSISVTALDYGKITVDTLEDWLHLLGFPRRVSQHYIDFSRGEDPEMERHRQALRDHGLEPLPYESAGLFPAVIVPQHHMGEVLYLIRESELKKIIFALKENAEASHHG